MTTKFEENLLDNGYIRFALDCKTMTFYRPNDILKQITNNN